jgi:hypothetical protein
MHSPRAIMVALFFSEGIGSAELGRGLVRSQGVGGRKD